MLMLGKKKENQETKKWMDKVAPWRRQICYKVDWTSDCGVVFLKFFITTEYSGVLTYLVLVVQHNSIAMYSLKHPARKLLLFGALRPTPSHAGKLSPHISAV